MPFNSDAIQWGVSKRQDGSMKLSFDGIVSEENVRHRETLFSGQGIDVRHVVSADLTHGDRIAVVSKADQGSVISAADGLVTDCEDVVLAVTVADCVPIFFFDPLRHAVGLAHSGWKGTVLNIARRVIEMMQAEYGSDPADVRAYIGPHIQAHHFEVKEDVAAQFDSYPQWITSNDGQTYIDLGSIIEQQLITVGLLPENIEKDPACTYCDEKKYYSYRRDKPAKLEAMIAHIGRRTAVVR